MTVGGTAVDVHGDVVWYPPPRRTWWLLGAGWIALAGSAAGVGPTLGLFSLPLAGIAATVVSVERRRPSRWWAAIAGAAVLGLGCAYLRMLSHSQIDSRLPAPLDRVALVVGLGAGAGALVGSLLRRPDGAAPVAP